MKASFLVPVITLGLLAGNAEAQQAFSFSGLKWGDSVGSVHETLVRNGFSGCKSLVEAKTYCSGQNDPCNCLFTGASITSGRAAFLNGKLAYVAVTAADGNATVDALYKKYGRPQRVQVQSTRPPGTVIDDLSKAQAPGSNHMWTSGEETLGFTEPSNMIQYASPQWRRFVGEIAPRVDTSKF